MVMNDIMIYLIQFRFTTIKTMVKNNLKKALSKNDR